MALEPSMVVELQHKLDKLKKEDRQLQDEIVQFSTNTLSNDLQIRRLKKRKIMIKEQIQKIDALLVPDIIAWISHNQHIPSTTQIITALNILYLSLHALHMKNRIANPLTWEERKTHRYAWKLVEIRKRRIHARRAIPVVGNVNAARLGHY